MQTQKIIYVSLISLLAVSLLIPALSAMVCQECGYDPCICDEGLDMYPVDETFVVFHLEAEVDKKSVERPTTDTAEMIKLYGKIFLISDTPEDIDLGGRPVDIQVYGSYGTHWKCPIIYTKSDGSFEFTFEILKTANLGFYDAIVTAAGKTVRAPFEVVGTDVESTPLQIEYDYRNLIVYAVLGVGFFAVGVWLFRNISWLHR
jgi:hypothetical protein